MKHPPYHLRSNKAVDRFLLVEMIKKLHSFADYDFSAYTYYGFGGPFLDDFRLLHHYFPELPLVSIERDIDTHKRQQFHKFTRNLKLVHRSVDRFLSLDFQPGGRDIFWFDFTDIKPDYFDWIQRMAPQLGDGSLIKVTFPLVPPCHPSIISGVDEVAKKAHRDNLIQRFGDRYESYLPPEFEKLLEGEVEYAALLSRMFRTSLEKAMEGSDSIPLLVCACRYADGLPMLSCSVLIVSSKNTSKIKSLIGNWKFGTKAKSDPILVDLPVLSAKERMRLEGLLPQVKSSGRGLAKALGYLIDDNPDRTFLKMKQYADFYRYYPVFAKVEV